MLPLGEHRSDAATAPNHPLQHMGSVCMQVQIEKSAFSRITLDNQRQHTKQEAVPQRFTKMPHLGAHIAGKNPG